MGIHRLIIVLIVFLISTILFKRAAGSLKLKELNMINALYYYILFFNLIVAL
jgi:hypothetical protein